MTHPEAQSLVAAAAVDDGNAALHRRIAELCEAVAARDAFLAIAAHELRNPMTPILGQVDLLLAAVKAGRGTPEQTEQRLERIQHNIHHYMKRAAVLLDVSRLTRGGLRLSPETFDLAALLQALAQPRATPAPRSRSRPNRLPFTWTDQRPNRLSITCCPTRLNTAAARRSSSPHGRTAARSKSRSATMVPAFPSMTGPACWNISSMWSA